MEEQIARTAYLSEQTSLEVKGYCRAKGIKVCMFYGDLIEEKWAEIKKDKNITIEGGEDE